LSFVTSSSLIGINVNKIKNKKTAPGKINSAINKIKKIRDIA
jgi:hypothetical protein